MTDELIFKYISDQANEEEKQLVRKWAEVSEERNHELSRMKNSWVLASLNNELDQKMVEREIQLIQERIRMMNKKANSKPLRIKWLRYAAVLFFIIGISGISGYFVSNSKFRNTGITQIIVPKGERSKVILPDGSSVQLNSESRLKFESSFQSGKRKVILEGEAFFEVTHDKLHPFIVEMDNLLQVEVLGTTFNVSSYADDNTITTYLESGKVKINIDGKEAIYLKPSEVLKFEKAKGIAVKQAIDDERYFDWTKGILNINGETIEELSRKLERRFDIEILFGDDEVRKHTYSGSLKDEDLNTVLSALEFLSALNYKRDGKVVTLFSKK